MKPGGFWVCPTCGLRNKVWAACASCGTTLADMASPESALRPQPLPTAPRKGIFFPYGLVAAAVVTAVAVAALLTRLLGGAALEWKDEPPAERPRAALPSAWPRSPAPGPTFAPQEALPAAPVTTPPSAVYTPGMLPPATVPPSAPNPTPAPTLPPAAEERPRLAIRMERPGGPDLRAQTEAVRFARARFERALRELDALSGASEEEEMEAMERLEEAARELRRAEALLDRARGRRR